MLFLVTDRVFINLFPAVLRIETTILEVRMHSFLSVFLFPNDVAVVNLC